MDGVRWPGQREMRSSKGPLFRLYACMNVRGSKREFWFSFFLFSYLFSEGPGILIIAIYCLCCCWYTSTTSGS